MASINFSHLLKSPSGSLFTNSSDKLRISPAFVRLSLCVYRYWFRIAPIKEDDFNTVRIFQTISSAFNVLSSDSLSVEMDSKTNAMPLESVFNSFKWSSFCSIVVLSTDWKNLVVHFSLSCSLRILNREISAFSSFKIRCPHARTSLTIGTSKNFSIWMSTGIPDFCMASAAAVTFPQPRQMTAISP